ncbi:MAG: histidine phosphatase family protein [Acidimicrobiia bacterium]
MIQLVRHGSTQANEGGLIQGRSLDLNLSALGFRQADALAARIAMGTRPARVVTSPLKRARQTAAIISKACDCALVEDERLMELNYGEWDGMPLADVPPSFWKSWRSDIAFTPPGGESLADVALRMHEVMAECSDSGEELVLVTHVAPIKAAVAAVLAAPPETVWNMFLDTASISRCTSRPKRSDDEIALTLTSFNDTAHLLAL